MAEAQAGEKQCWILLVEDSDDDALIVEKAFRRGGLTCGLRRARDAEEALRALEAAARNNEPKELPRAVLLDLSLPAVSGFELLERILRQERLRHIPLIVLSGSARASDAERALALGARKCFEKSVFYEEVVEYLREMIKSEG